MHKTARIFAIGILISLLLVYQHFNKDASKFCTFGSMIALFIRD